MESKKYFKKLNYNIISNCLMVYFTYEDLLQVQKVNKIFHRSLNGLCIEPIILKYCSSFKSKYSSLNNMIFFPFPFINEINTKINLLDSEHSIELTKKGISHIIKVNVIKETDSDFLSDSFSISYIPPLKYKVYIKHNLFYVSSQSKKLIIRVNEDLAFETVYPSNKMEEQFDQFIDDQVNETGDCSFMVNRIKVFLTVLDITKYHYRNNNIITFFIIGGLKGIRIESIILEPY